MNWAWATSLDSFWRSASFPMWLTLAAARPTTGRVLHYQQFVHPEGFESVSFAAAAFYE